MLNNFDYFIFNFFNHTCHNAFLDKVMPYITETGGGEWLFFLALAFFVFRGVSTKKAGIALMAGLTFTYHFTEILKNLIARQRPFIALEDVNVIFTSKGFSFPSTHSAMAFMAAFVLSYYFKKGYIFYSLALLVGISRIYLGQHFPTDIVGGAIVGCLSGYLLTQVLEKIKSK